MDILTLVVRIITFGSVVWTAATLTGLLVMAIRDRRRPPTPRPPTKLFQGRLPLPPVDIRPYRTIRSIDTGETWTEGDQWYPEEDDNILYFDPSKHASYIHRRLEVVKRQNESN